MVLVVPMDKHKNKEVRTKIHERIEENRKNEPDTTTPMVVNILFWYEGEACMRSDSEKKQHFLQHKEKHDNGKEAYTDESKSMRRKACFAAVFVD